MGTPTARRAGAEAARREQSARFAAQVHADPVEFHEVAAALQSNLRRGWTDVSFVTACGAAMAAYDAQHRIQARKGLAAGDVVAFLDDDGAPVTATISGWTPIRGEAFVMVNDEPYGRTVHVDEMIR